MLRPTRQRKHLLPAEIVDITVSAEVGESAQFVGIVSVNEATYIPLRTAAEVDEMIAALIDARQKAWPGGSN